MQLNNIDFNNTQNQTANGTLLVRNANVNSPSQNNQAQEGTNVQNLTVYRNQSQQTQQANVQQVVPRQVLPIQGLNLNEAQQNDINIPAANQNIRQARFNVDTNVDLRDLDVNRQNEQNV